MAGNKELRDTHRMSAACRLNQCAKCAKINCTHDCHKRRSG